MLLSVENVTKSYRAGADQTQVLNGVSLSLDAGESLALTGESGSGKCPLLHLVAGLDGFDGGEIRVAGTALSQLNDRGLAQMRQEHIGLVFQQFNLVPSLTVLDNLALQARLSGRHDPAWTHELATSLGLDAALRQYPETLSGGQQQRVAIGRVLAARPALVLADEPTGNLDEENSEAVLRIFLDLIQTTSAALLLVTHSPSIAKRLSRRVHLSHGTLA